MEKYEYLGQTIMEQDRHQFIYGYNGEERKQFLKTLASKYPIVLNKNMPMAVCLEEIGLPKINIDVELDKDMIEIISRDYLSLTITSKIINNLLSQIDKNDLDKSRISLFLRAIRSFIMNKKEYQLKDLNELNNLLIESKDGYLEAYKEYIKSAEIKSFMEKLPISFIDLNTFSMIFKEMLNNNSYFGIIVNHQKPIALSSYKAINELVSYRINGDISMKIACEPDEWKTNRDLKGEFIEVTHDYGTVEFDDSLKEHIKKMKRKYNIFNED